MKKTNASNTPIAADTQFILNPDDTFQNLHPAESVALPKYPVIPKIAAQSRKPKNLQLAESTVQIAKRVNGIGSEW